LGKHEPFNFKSGEELLQKAEALNLMLPFQDAIDPLFSPLEIGNKTVPNRLAVHPMEGYDGNTDGSPSDLTIRRYLRYAEGGSGLIWFEAASVIPEGRSNPRQLMLTPENLDAYKRLLEQLRIQAYSTFGQSHELLFILQLTHSGRYSKPDGQPKSQIACFNPHLDQSRENLAVISDDSLNLIMARFQEAIWLAYKAGFDGVDIKACHGYLVHELLGSFTRSKSVFGESFNNRTRFLIETIQHFQQKIRGFIPAVRLNVTDGIPYPFGFGASDEGFFQIDLSEPRQLIERLFEKGCQLINITAGIGAHSPHIGRPFDRPATGSPLPEEHPLVGVCRLIELAGNMQQAFPGLPMVGTGYSWLRQFFPNTAAAAIQNKHISLIGLGRSSFAYPYAPRDLMDRGKLDPGKVCIACSRCTELMRHGRISGCVMRDTDIYGKEYKRINIEK
jgi:2,4-dienoyl-CoA reductase-like NADH-dependent reductase (Old Yellow Enzyme family)